jgi:hypothetical protein
MGEFGGHNTYIRSVELNVMSPEYPHVMKFK